MKKLSLGAFIFIMCTCCVSRNSIDTRIGNYFNQEEVQEIQLLLSSVDGFVQKQFPNADLLDAYHFYLDSLCAGKINPGLFSFKHYELRDSIISKLTPNLANELFIKQEPLAIHYEDIHLYEPQNWHGIEFNYNSRIIMYFEELGKSDDYFKSTIKRCNEQGKIGPTVLSNVLCMNENFDFKDTNYRLWVAINLLSIGKPIDILIDEYLNNSENST